MFLVKQDRYSRLKFLQLQLRLHRVCFGKIFAKAINLRLSSNKLFDKNLLSSKNEVVSVSVALKRKKKYRDRNPETESRRSLNKQGRHKKLISKSDWDLIKTERPRKKRSLPLTLSFSPLSLSLSPFSLLPLSLPLSHFLSLPVIYLFSIKKLEVFLCFMHSACYHSTAHYTPSSVAHEKAKINNVVRRHMAWLKPDSWLRRNDHIY